jgi:hypothetical protein
MNSKMAAKCRAVGTMLTVPHHHLVLFKHTTGNRRALLDADLHFDQHAI